MRRFAQIAAALIVVAIVAFWQWSSPSGVLRYRMSVDVLVDGKVHSGSSVLEARFDYQPKWTPSQIRVVGSLRGEAVTVDLGAKGLLFVLLTGPRSQSGTDYGGDPEAIPIRQFLGTTIGGLDPAQIRQLASLKARADLPLAEMPMVVRFRNLDDQNSVELLDPNDLSRSFGPGSRVVSATLEAVQSPVTSGIESVLPWLKSLHGGYLSGGPTSRNAPLGLYAGNFRSNL